MDRPRDPFDDLADLFLTPEFVLGDGSDAHAAPTGPVSGEATVRIAMLGHLPVSAGLWITQLADRLARESGPVGVVRFVAGQVQVEVLRAGLGSSIAEALDLEEALEAAVRLADRWLVVPDSAVTPAEILRSGARSLMLLSGADEAAVVGAYRILKSIAEEASAEQVSLPHLQVAILGAGEVAVQEAILKINRTASAFLGMELPLALSMQRMEPVQSSYRLTLPAPRTLGFEDLPRLLEGLIARRPALSSDAAPRPLDLVDAFDGEASPHGETLAGSPEADRPGAAPLDSEPPRIEIRPEGAKIAWPFASTPPAAAERSAGETPLPSPIRGNAALLRRLAAGRAMPWSDLAQQTGPAASGAPVPPIPPIPPRAIEPPASLPPGPVDRMRTPTVVDGEAARLVERPLPTPLSSRFPMLRPLPVTCPYHPRVELAVDARGQLHLVAPLAALGEVQATASWVRDHASLLQLACPGLARLDGHEPVIDLVTDRPEAGGDLMQTRIRVHLLAAVGVGDAVGWLRMPLNAAAREETPGASAAPA
jgi:hypothetical protein